AVPPGLRRAGRRVVDDVVDRRSDREDLGGVLVRHRDPVGVLELLDERVEVERVGLEVFFEAGGLIDPGRIEVELVGQVGLDEREHLFAGHDGLTVATGADFSAPAAVSAAWVRPTTSPLAPRAASRIACEMP